jgi:N6-L-threonylcarbamoyladenine synthase
MIDSPDFDFSFSGIKTSVRYAIEKKGGNETLTEEDRMGIARDFEESVTEVLLKKTQRAVDTYGAHTVIVGGGVSANSYIRDIFTKTFKREYPDLTLYLPPRNLSTDNSIMIALTGHAKKDTALSGDAMEAFKADGNLEL